MNPKLYKVITVLGVTSSGKTKLAVDLAQKFKGEIVSADSRQVYKEFNIGTAKPKGIWGKEFIYKNIPHYLIDCINPKQDFTLAEYQTLAVEKLKNISENGKVPFLVGGTPLYLKAVLENWHIPEVKPNPELRSKLEEKNLEELFAELNTKDPEAALITGATNKRRIIRALEVIHETGEKFSNQRKIGKPIFDSLKIGIKIEPEELEKRIIERTHEMIKNGLVKEVENLYKKYGWNIVPMQSIGYAEFKEYFENKISLEEVIGLIIKNTIAYTKRQMTWFKKDKDINWITSQQKAENLINKFLL